MPDPIIDSINAAPGKPWWQSKTIWGLGITAVSIFAPKYQPIAEAIPYAADQVLGAAGLFYALYGRVKAEKPITK